MLLLLISVALGSSIGYSLGPEMIGKPAPSFTLKTVDGRASLSLADLRGQVVIIDFWATWCAPCRHSLPQLSTFEAGQHGVKVVAINIDDERENAIDFLKQNRVKMTSLYDESKHVVGSYDVPAMPSALVIDKDGVVRFVHGGYTENDIATMMKEARSLL
jgi:cytochrome c biogenesis protein CcmG/thiol:disulfide interchange protein DsbE